MITVRLKQKFDTKAEAIHTLLCYIDQGHEDDFELVGPETNGITFDAEQLYKETLKELGLETT